MIIIFDEHKYSQLLKLMHSGIPPPAQAGRHDRRWTHQCRQQVGQRVQIPLKPKAETSESRCYTVPELQVILNISRGSVWTAPAERIQMVSDWKWSVSDFQEKFWSMARWTILILSRLSLCKTAAIDSLPPNKNRCYCWLNQRSFLRCSQTCHANVNRKYNAIAIIRIKYSSLPMK